MLPVYTPVIHPKLKKLFGNILEISQGPAIDMAEKLHRFGTGQVSEQLMGTPLDDDMVGMLAENETNICQYPINSILPLYREPYTNARASPTAHYWLTRS